MPLCKGVLDKPLSPWELHYQKRQDSTKSISKVPF